MGIKLKRSAVAARAPVVGDLELGELAVNTYDGRLYLKKNNGTEAIVEVTGSDDTRHGSRAGGALHAAATTSVAGFLSSADKTKLDGVSSGADATGATIHAATAKTTPVDADTVGLIDSAASNVLKKLSWANLKAALTASPTLTNPIFLGTPRQGLFTISDAAGFVVNPRNGSLQRITLGASRTPVATGWVNGDSVTMFIADGTAYAITWSTMAVVWKGGTAPTLATTGYTEVNLTMENSVLRGVVIGDFAS